MEAENTTKDVKQTKEEDNWAEMSDGEQQPEVVDEKQHTIKTQVKKKNPNKGFKNRDGDYVVTTIDIQDSRTGIKKDKDGEEDEEDETDSDTEYDDEDDEQKPAEVEEETKEGKFKFREFSSK